MRKWLSRIIKITAILIAFFAVMLTVLANMGGSSDNLKAAVSDYITAATGMRAEIGTLHKMTFFPAVTIDAGNIELHKDDDLIAEGRIESALLKISFWDVITSRSKLQNLQIEGASFLPGTLNAQSVEIERIGIDETPTGEAFLAAQGKIGPHKINAEIALQSKGKNFTLPQDGDFIMNVGTITAKGIFRPRKIGGFHIRDFTAAHNGQEILSGAFSILRNRNGNMSIRGDVKTIEHKTETEMDIEVSRQKLSGRLNAYRFDMADFEGGSRLMNMLTAWSEIFALKNTTMDIDAKLNAQTFINDGKTERAAALILKREDGKLSVLKQAVGVPAR
ncbi:MAG: hypothetical protein ACRBCT_01765 [Alphaproteobacteria bacterium]